MYTPGVDPIAFDVDGIRIGLVLGLEMLFPDLFTAYADDGVDLVVAASHGGGIFGQLANSYAMINQVVIAAIARRDSTPTFSYKARHGFYDHQLAEVGPSPGLPHRSRS